MASFPKHDPYAEALELEKSIKKQAFSPRYDSIRYRTMVTALHDCIQELALAGEFGKLAKIAQYSLDLLEPERPNGTRSYHHLKSSDLLHHIEMLPTHHDGLVSDISEDKALNMAVVRSIIKADFLESESMIGDLARITRALAENNDHVAWVALLAAVESQRDQYRLSIESIGRFDLDHISKHKDHFSPIKNAINKHKPGEVGWGTSEDTRVDSTELFDAMMVIGCQKSIPRILKVCWLEFKEPFMLQRNMQRYGFTPDEQYRKTLAGSVHMHEGRYRHVSTSYYQHELTGTNDLLPQREPMKPAILAEVLELDGKETPYGTVHFTPGKAGEVIDVTLKAALAKDTWEKVSKAYDVIPKRLLMKSHVYKGHMLCDDLGM